MLDCRSAYTRWYSDGASEKLRPRSSTSNVPTGVTRTPLPWARTTHSKWIITASLLSSALSAPPAGP